VISTSLIPCFSPLYLLSFSQISPNYSVRYMKIELSCLVGIEATCNSVKGARGAHFGRLSKTVPKGAGSHANSGRNRQRRFMRL
jgi:hypothetical protein